METKEEFCFRAIRQKRMKGKHGHHRTASIWFLRQRRIRLYPAFAGHQIYANVVQNHAD